MKRTYFLTRIAASVLMLAMASGCARKEAQKETLADLSRPSVPPVAVLTGAQNTSAELNSLPARIDSDQLASIMQSAPCATELELVALPKGKLVLLDVRTAEEYAVGFIPGAILKPYDAMPGNLDGLPRWAPIVVYCRSGRRSALAAATLKASGYTNVADFGAIDRYTGTLARP